MAQPMMHQPRFPSSAEARFPSGLAAALAAAASHRRALLALALILAVGLAVLDDYGVSLDEAYQRWLPTATLAHIRGESDALPSDHNKFYGVAFETPLLLAERAFGIEDKRGVWLSRHLLTHLFFLSGGLFAYLLASRLFGNRIIALSAMLLFLLHPRLYAHSFFNTKDIPFLTMSMIALFLMHRAFRRDGPSAFALLGVGVGILINLRIMGIIPLTAILALLALDIVLSRGRVEKERVLVSTGAFALATALTAYVLLPYLWPNPIGRSIEWWTTLSSHPLVFTHVFMGAAYQTSDYPAGYVPVWFSITSPPFALLLGLVGVAFILGTAAESVHTALRNATLRFGLLLIGFLAMPVAAVILFDVNVYHGWRQVYFLWAPFSLLGIFGLRWMLSTLGRSRMRKQAYIGMFAGFAAIAVSMGLIHPNQQDFFNFFVDRVTPEHLKTQYHMDYWWHTVRQALESFSDDAYQYGEPTVTGAAEALVRENVNILPGARRERIHRIGADAFVMRAVFWNHPELETRYVEVYNNTILTLRIRPDLRTVYERIASKEPGLRSVFNVHYDKDMVVYIKEQCGERDESLDGHFALDFFPHKNEDLDSDNDRKQRFESVEFEFSKHGAAFDGKCVASVPAPYYSIALIRASQYAPKPEDILWEEFRADSANLLWEGEFRTDSAYQDIYRRIENEEPAARSVFDVYVLDGSLAYIKEPCAISDVENAFFLHVIPNQRNDLPDAARAFGFDNLDFTSFLRDGAIFEGRCVASVPLPGYEVAGVRTGQRTEDGTTSWSVTFPVDPDRLRTAYLGAVSAEPIARSVFDIHLTNGGLVYAKEPCEPGDANARFFLHIVPERVGDLPEDRKQYGFDNLDFDFSARGALFDGRCLARVPLPDYPMRSARTGQFGGAGKAWSVAFEIPE